ncbi:unnamed protein product [Rotaria sp. Silwood1]|nr:unnamed protein product [Rotaria sp. Silwood1]
MHEQDIVGFICFSSHASERQSALITDLFVTKNYQHQRIDHHLLQTCRRIISEEIQYQHLYGLCSDYQKDGYKFLLDHHFFTSISWTTFVFLSGISRDVGGIRYTDTTGGRGNRRGKRGRAGIGDVGDIGNVGDICDVGFALVLSASDALCMCFRPHDLLQTLPISPTYPRSPIFPISSIPLTPAVPLIPSASVH